MVQSRLQTAAEDTAFAPLPPSLPNDRIICLQGALFLHYPFCHGFTLLYSTLPASIFLSLSLVDKINGVGGATPVPDAVSYCVILCRSGILTKEVLCCRSWGCETTMLFCRWYVAFQQFLLYNVMSHFEVHLYHNCNQNPKKIVLKHCYTSNLSQTEPAASQHCQPSSSVRPSAQ